MTEKAKILYQENESPNLTGEIDIMFNPTTYSVSRSVNYGSSSGSSKGKGKKGAAKGKKENRPLRDYPNFIYNGGSADSLSLEIILNTYEFQHVYDPSKIDSSKLSITEKVIQLKKLTLINPKIHRPPLCKFEWGKFNFTGYVNRLNVTYTMFLDDGTPVRARVSFEMTGVEYKDSNLVENIPLESPDRTKRRLVSENQQLWEFAQDEYGDASKWREIAKANGIKNPLYIKSGTRLTVPALTK
jgi:nucleoid-associated protein YgaU